jgi:serine/threonine protein kinase
VVDVLDMGSDEHGLPFLVMELLAGRSLDRVLMGEGKLPPHKVIEWLLPIAGALASLHDVGIVHRDVKPSNIFLCRMPNGQALPKLLDFGLARAVSDLRLTRSGVVIGTPLYMAPEHASGAAVGPQADVWSLGIVLYECLSGASPYVSNDGAAVATQVLAGKVRPLGELCPDLPTPMVQAVERALRRDLGHRYHDMRELARGLLTGALASGLPVPQNPDPVGLPKYASWLIGDRVRLAAGSLGPGETAGNGAPNGPRFRDWLQGFGSHLRHWKSWSAALALIGLAALLGAWLLRRPDSRAAGAARPPKPAVSQAAVRPPEAPKPVVQAMEFAPPNASKPAQLARPPAPASGNGSARKPPRRRKPSSGRPQLDVETEWK